MSNTSPLVPEPYYVPGPPYVTSSEIYIFNQMYVLQRRMPHGFYIGPRDLVVDTERGAKWQVGECAYEYRGTDAAKSEHEEEVKIALSSGLSFAYQVEGPEAGTRAFVKTYKQIVHDDPMPNFNVYTSERVDKELYALRDLSESGVTPQFLGCVRETQGPEDVRPGGYVWYIFTHVLGGVIPQEIASVEEFDDCRIAMAKAAHTLSSHGWRLPLAIEPDQMRWDKASNRCWFTCLREMENIDQPRNPYWLWGAYSGRAARFVDWHSGKDPVLEAFKNADVPDASDECLEQTLRQVRSLANSLGLVYPQPEDRPVSPTSRAFLADVVRMNILGEASEIEDEFPIEQPVADSESESSGSDSDHCDGYLD